MLKLFKKFRLAIIITIAIGFGISFYILCQKNNKTNNIETTKIKCIIFDIYKENNSCWMYMTDCNKTFYDSAYRYSVGDTVIIKK